MQWGVVEFRTKLKKRAANQKAAKELPGQADDLAKGAASVVDAFTPKGTIPKLEFDVEIVK